MELTSEILKFVDPETTRGKVIKLYLEGYHSGDIAKKLGLQKSTVTSSKTRAIQVARRRGYDPGGGSLHPSPEGYFVKGTSTLYGPDGDLKAQWVKTNIEAEEQIANVKEAINEFLELEVPQAPKIPKPKTKADEDVIPWIQIGDGHLGMIAYENETGQDFNLEIAERELIFAVNELIERAPKTQRVVIQDLGDMTHYQTFAAQTESGHILDFDKRYPAMIAAHYRVMKSIVESALRKFEFVDVIINQGNHSRANDIHIAETLRWVYAKNKRLNVLDNSSPFITYRMGKTFVLSHHSDKCKPDRLAAVMSSDYSKDFGESTYRYIDIGHIHHKQISKELPGVIVESWNQLAPADRWAHQGGWRSRSFLTCVLRSKTYGEKGRFTITAEEVKDRLNNRKPGATSNQRREVFTV